MSNRFSLLLVAVFLPVCASAQQHPLSPPDRPPMPLSANDQVLGLEEAKSKAPAPFQFWPAVGAPNLVSSRLSSGDKNIDSLVWEAAATHRVDPRLILLVMQAESGFSPRAVSPKGAAGLMQLMPSTAARLGIANIFDPRENVFGGVRYLRWLLDRFGGDVRLALAAYNAGEHAVEFYGNQMPPFLETQNYVRSIISRYSRLRGSDALLLRPGGIDSDKSAERFPDYNQIVRFGPSGGTGDDQANRKQ